MRQGKTFVRRVGLAAVVTLLLMMGIKTAHAQNYNTAPAPPTAFVTGTPPAGTLICNGGFENAAEIIPPNLGRQTYQWGLGTTYAQVDTAQHSQGLQSLRIDRPTGIASSEPGYAVNSVVWQQPWQYPFTVECLSKAQNVAPASGGLPSEWDYSIYCDLTFTDDTHLFAQYEPFSPGTHDWEYKRIFINPPKPMKSMNVYVLFRGDWRGTVWFDGVTVRPANEGELTEQINIGRPKPPKFIEFGWDYPTTAFCRTNYAAMQNQPFDGVIIKANDTYLFKNVVRDDAYYAQALSDMQACNWTKFTDNFAILHANDGSVDFFDNADWNNVLLSVGAFARFCKNAGLKGVCFDPEAYVAPYGAFDYTKQKYRSTKTYAQYSAQAKLRGQQFMQTLQNNYPGLTVLSLFGNSANWNYLPLLNRDAKLSQWGFGLLSPFIDGMMSVINTNVTFVDGCEWGYYMESEPEFVKAYHRIKHDTPVLVSSANRRKYNGQTEVGFGLYPDRNWNISWSLTNPSTNYYTPEKFENNARSARKTADQYVWVYTEGDRNWWSGPDTLGPYREALQRAKFLP